jgi:hypothetical protein
LSLIFDDWLAHIGQTGELDQDRYYDGRLDYNDPRYSAGGYYAWYPWQIPKMQGNVPKRGWYKGLSPVDWARLCAEQKERKDRLDPRRQEQATLQQQREAQREQARADGRSALAQQSRGETSKQQKEARRLLRIKQQLNK